MAVVEVERRGNVEIVTLNRPEKRNALNGEVLTLLGRAFEAAEADDDVRVVILAANGEKTFCAGMDLAAFASGKGMEVDGPGMGIFTQRMYTKPLIAAVGASALAGGFELVLACDLVVAVDTAQFGIPEVKRGLVAAGGGVLHLPSRIPTAVALEMGLTGEPITARRAHELGFVNKLVPAGTDVVAEAMALAELIAANGPLATKVTKELMVRSASLGRYEMQKDFGKAVGPVFSSKDAIEGATAFAEKRAPVWTGR